MAKKLPTNHFGVYQGKYGKIDAQTSNIITNHDDPIKHQLEKEACSNFIYLT